MPTLDDVPEDRYFTQKLCHFNPKVTETWQQAFWQNDKYYKNNGINFLHYIGEWVEGPEHIINEKVPFVGWAKKLGARLINFQHRFYGKSRPRNDTSVVHLHFLNSRQALADLAEFIKAKNAEWALEEPKWVIFGGSYGGNLALWFRQQYPELTVGAVGSSAPIEATVDFFGKEKKCRLIQVLRLHSSC